jgi:hypothetical protein
VDSTWRGGWDHWFATKARDASSGMTYRDEQTYENIAQRFIR